MSEYNIDVITLVPNEIIELKKKIRAEKTKVRNYSKQFLKEYFNLDFDLKINYSFNNSGRYGALHSVNNQPKMMNISMNILLFSILIEDDSFLLELVRHELIHSAFRTLGIKKSNGLIQTDYDDTFETVCIHLNATSNKIEKWGMTEENQRLVMVNYHYAVHNEKGEFMGRYKTGVNSLSESQFKLKPSSYGEVGTKYVEVGTPTLSIMSFGYDVDTWGQHKKSA